MKYILILVLLGSIFFQFRLIRDEDACLKGKLLEVARLKDMQLSRFLQANKDFEEQWHEYQKYAEKINDTLSLEELLNVIQKQDKWIDAYRSVILSLEYGPYFGLITGDRLKVYREFVQLDSTRIRIHLNDQLCRGSKIVIPGSDWKSAKLVIEFVTRTTQKSSFISCDLNELVCR